MAEHDWDPADVVVVLDHPFGVIEITLVEWMSNGPGPRPLIRPIAARHRLTGEELPLTVIPVRYRNDEVSRRLIAAGEIDPPWDAV